MPGPSADSESAQSASPASVSLFIRIINNRAADCPNLKRPALRSPASGRPRLRSSTGGLVSFRLGGTFVNGNLNTLLAWPAPKMRSFVNQIRESADKEDCGRSKMMR